MCLFILQLLKDFIAFPVESFASLLHDPLRILGQEEVARFLQLYHSDLAIGRNLLHGLTAFEYETSSLQSMGTPPLLQAQ